MSKIVVYMDNSDGDLPVSNNPNGGHAVNRQHNIRAVGFRGRCQHPKGSDRRWLKKKQPLADSNQTIYSMTDVVSVPDDAEMTVDEDSFESDATHHDTSFNMHDNEIYQSSESEIDRGIGRGMLINVENETYKFDKNESFNSAMDVTVEDSECQFVESIKVDTSESTECKYLGTTKSGISETVERKTPRKVAMITSTSNENQQTFNNAGTEALDAAEAEFWNIPDEKISQIGYTETMDQFGDGTESKTDDLFPKSNWQVEVCSQPSEPGTDTVEEREKPKMTRHDSGISLPESQDSLSSSNRLARSLCWLLRHGAEECRLHLSSEGFLYVKDIIGLPQFHGVTIDDIKTVVSSEKDKRFTLEPGRSNWKIKANYGHSLSFGSCRGRRTRQSTRLDRRRRRPTRWDPMERLSRSMAKILRHTAVKRGLFLMTGGYVYVDDMLDLWEMKTYKFDDVKNVVDHDVKGRFKLSPDKTNLSWKIKATGKHSLKFIKEESPKSFVPYKSSDNKKVSLKNEKPKTEDKKVESISKADDFKESKKRESQILKQDTQYTNPEIEKTSKDEKQGLLDLEAKTINLTVSDWSLDSVGTNVEPDEKKLKIEILPSPAKSPTKKPRLVKKMPKVPLKALTKMTEKSGKKKKVLVKMKTCFKRRGSLDELREKRLCLKRNIKK